MLELPFTTDQFLEIFGNYNRSIWPVQIAAYLLGLLAVVLGIWRKKLSNKVIGSILGLFWIWTGGVYHIIFFSEINQAAFLFGALFILQGILFLIAGVAFNKLDFDFKNDIYGITGLFMIGYAMIIYPLLGSILGHGYPEAPMFGVAPCPMTIFTFGILLWTSEKFQGWLLIIPGLWSVVGFMAAIKLGILEDTGLLISGIVGVTMLLYRNRIKKIIRTTNYDYS